MNYNDLDACSKISIKARIDLWEKYDHTIYPRKYLKEKLKLYKPAILRKFIDDKDKYAFVAEVEDEVVGLALGKVTYGISDISWIAVDPEWQGEGIGRKILETIIEYSKSRDVTK